MLEESLEHIDKGEPSCPMSRGSTVETFGPVNSTPGAGRDTSNVEDRRPGKVSASDDASSNSSDAYEQDDDDDMHEPSAHGPSSCTSETSQSTATATASSRVRVSPHGYSALRVPYNIAWPLFSPHCVTCDRPKSRRLKLWRYFNCNSTKRTRPVVRSRAATTSLKRSSLLAYMHANATQTY